VYALRLSEDRLAPAAHLALPALNRVLYALTGTIDVTSPGPRASVHAEAAWQGVEDCEVVGGPGGAVVLRYELLSVAPGPAPGAPPRGVGVTLLLEHPLALDPAQKYLMRCDRVDFAPGGEALPHGHKGGGIRCLIAGGLEVRVGARPGRRMRRGDAWFETGVEPVHAIASATEPTSFIRVAILPRAIRGQSSIVYVDPAHASVKPRRYTVYVDAPIEIV
jgi:quercetin dioxygenase-like cupin family protein